MRVILYTGKGGVGKTTVAAATAVRCAELGYRTLVVSTDAAHSLGDSLDREIGEFPTEIAPNLWGQEVNALHELENHWERIHIYLTSLFASQGVEDIVAEELASPPGMEEVASLMWIKHHKREGKFDVLIIDCAPTGETLQLLAFPDVAKWYLNKIFPIERKVMKVARPVVQPFISIPLPGDDIFGHVKDLLLDLESMKKILGDPKVCTVRLVLNLEKMVVKEAQRAFTYLSLYDYLTDLVVVNRVLPDEVTDSYFTAWRKAQKRYSEVVENAFSPLPINYTKLFNHEIIGLESLSEMARSIYGEEDPSRIYYRAVPQRIRKEGDHYVLHLQLPFVGKDDVDITHRQGELYVTVGPYKREISLPRVLASKKVTRGKLEEGMLSVTFADKR
ncbi:MAG TPA: TRC40/GET3/ArsA family transport-energizing ATPase [Candidatus Dormibacteraeota bacterium]|nr:TRC40/GET3/ArsA family transport-energizing ATPase [Candidatus Dormibacteraeota bacterium]